MTDTTQAPVETTTPAADAAPTTAPEAVDPSQQPAEVKTEQQIPVEKQPTEEAKTEEVKVPESYDFKAQEGKEFDPDTISKFTDVAKELGLSQEAAQKILDKMAPQLEQRHLQAMAEAQKQWIDSSRNDKEFGGANFDENLSVAKKAITNFASPEMVKMLNETGLGNHPEVIRMFIKVGKSISEDNAVIRSNAPHNQSVGPKTQDQLAESLYGKKSN